MGGGGACFFGVNFADGRIKCYPTEPRGESAGYFSIYVRGNPAYGVNSFQDNGDGTVTDNATTLTWQQGDSGVGLLWGDALAYCDALSLGSADDWRLPDAKELQSIIDYTRTPDTTNSAAIDPVFGATQIVNEGGIADYAFYWTSTTHITYANTFDNAVYVSFGRALGNFNEAGWIDVHGAGAQRSDPKSGVKPDQVDGFGPQGDAIRASNYVRCVRGGAIASSAGDDPNTIPLTSSTGRPGGGGQDAPPSNGGGQGGQGQPPSNGGGQGQGGGNQSGPPAEAQAACNGLTEGTACTVNSPNGAVNGTCRTIQSSLACVP
ncbi:MAG: DUF1566 domain-containing protein [Chloroflexota bacterium]